MSTEESAYTSTEAEVTPSERDPGNFRNIAIAAYSDFQENKFRAGISGAAAIAGQGIGIGRLVVAPHVTLEVLHQTHNAVAAGAATGTVFGIMCLAVGETLNDTIGQYSRVIEVLREKSSSKVKFVADRLPGLNEPAESGKNTIASKIASLFKRHSLRGLAVVGPTASAYVGVAGIEGRSKSEIRKLSAVNSLDAALVFGTISGLSTEVILRVAEENPDLAQHIEDYAASSPLWLAVTCGLIAAKHISHTRKQAQI